MASNTGRFQWPIPPWNADWQKWQGQFDTFAQGVDAAVFEVMEHMQLVPHTLPSVEITEAGGVYTFTQAGEATFISRTLQVEIAVGPTDLDLTVGALVCAQLQAGAVGPQEVEWELRVSQTEVDPNLVVLGVVKADYSIAWFNGAVLPAGVAMGLFATCLTAARELQVRVYEQAAQPTLSANHALALWVDTDDSDKVYLVFRRGVGDAVKVQLT